MAGGIEAEQIASAAGVIRMVLFACTAGVVSDDSVRLRGRAAKGGRAPCNPGEGLAPLRTPIRCMRVPSAWRTCLREDWSRQRTIGDKAQ
jgi:hypothetical protein